jgi:acylphosphatase
MQKTISIIVTGKVQGVFYRQSTKVKAIALGITGEVKNTPDDKVSIIATGTKEQLDQLIEWCRQGPSKAKVRDVTVEEMTLKSFDKFAIAR